MPDVALTFDFDAMSLWIGSFKATSPGVISRGEFAPKGVERVLALLAKHEIPSTFFVPGQTVLAYPDTVRAIVAGGHEVGHHGFVHERVTELSPEREREVLERGIEIIGDVAGAPPVGYRSPSWDFTEQTLDLLVEHGFLYDSSLMGSDFELYWPRTGDVPSPDGPYEFGTEVPVVEIPVSWLLDDFPHFEYVRGGLATMKPPSQVYEIWSAEFDFYAGLDAGGLCYTLTNHPEVIGRGSRIAMLDRLIAAMKETTGVRFATLGTVAAEWKASRA
jgi:peptidoglycan/xylan/chitin deacetylase (PgdA/CDA1 family)